MLNAKNSFHVTAKPIGAECNLNCAYCYYLHKKDMLHSRGRMSDETLEKFIQQYIESQSTDTVFFTWHGGEPTLLGIDFFKKVIELQKKYANGKYIENDLQTNGVLLDDAWCQFLKENHFLVGLSVDGPVHLNQYRQKNTGEDSTIDSMRAAALLKKHDVPFNTLTVVHAQNAKEPLRVYRFLKEVIGSRHMQFIPCVEPKNFKEVAPLAWDETSLPSAENVKNFVTDFAVDPKEWGKFLSVIFDEWYEKDQGDVFVYLFENFLSSWLGRGAMACVFDEKCGHAMALDRDGRVYACDHFCYPEYAYGNIHDKSLEAMGCCSSKEEFSKIKQQLPKQCRACKWLKKCYGECPKKRFVKTAEGEPGLNYLCEGYRAFFEHIDERMFELMKKYG